MSVARKAAIVLMLSAAAVLMLIQLVPVRIENPPSRGEMPVPAEVAATLARSCDDCHSNHTRWPWYSRIAPLSWMVARDVEVGRKEINFSEWGDYYPNTRTRKIRWMQRALRDDNMPPWLYLAIHPGARLSDAERAALNRWIENELAASADERNRQ